ncbi:hypothetical protein NQ318_015161 [Aromia moschata]|uniref:Uncharacterized protein n=1 Tax=Aromia moschata TaxID=1265417 RepID=A0AAV8XZ00_9CUCU|nr:hypothetical protein NQ318_015161 [Aromia moschata]
MDKQSQGNDKRRRQKNDLMVRVNEIFNPLLVSCVQLLTNLSIYIEWSIDYPNLSYPNDRLTEPFNIGLLFLKCICINDMYKLTFVMRTRSFEGQLQMKKIELSGQIANLNTIDSGGDGGLHLRGGDEGRMPADGGTPGSESAHRLPRHNHSGHGGHCYDPEYAKMEAWLDEHPDFVQDYFLSCINGKIMGQLKKRKSSDTRQSACNLENEELIWQNSKGDISRFLPVAGSLTQKKNFEKSLVLSGFLGSLITILMSEFQNSRWRIQYGRHPESNFKFFDYFASNFVHRGFSGSLITIPMSEFQNSGW